MHIVLGPHWLPPIVDILNLWLEFGVILFRPKNQCSETDGEINVIQNFDILVNDKIADFVNKIISKDTKE